MAAVMLALAAPGASAATLTADYRFQNTRSSSVGSPPDLVDIGPGTNTFVTDTVEGQAQTVLAFPMGNGLSLSPTTGVVPNGTYSIVARFRFDTTSGFRRILDFKNGTSDNGLYVNTGKLQFYPYAGGSGAPIGANIYVQVALTRNSAGTMVGYVDGVQQFSVNDAANQYGVISAANVLRFFRDDGAEHSAGRVARIRLFDAALTAAEVADLSAPPAGTIEAVPFRAPGWKYKVVGWGAEPSFQAVAYDDSAFSVGTAAFGTLGVCPQNNPDNIHTTWPINTDLLLRRSVTLPAGATGLRVRGTVDNDATVYVNGQQIGYVESGNCIAPNIDFFAPNSALVAGDNVLAIRGHDYGGVTFLDVRVTYLAPANRAPVVDAGPDVAGDEGSPISLQGSASDPDNDPLTTAWTFTPGIGVDPGATCSFADPSAAATTITCTDDGTYTATLTASDGTNAPVSDSSQVTVTNQAPTLTITTPSDGAQFTVGTEVVLSGSFTDPGTNDTHTCSVNWGDGTTEAASVTESNGSGTCAKSHAFTSPGAYTIELTANDDDGGSDTESVTVVVNKIGTTSTLTSAPNPSTFGESVTFSDEVCGGGTGTEPTGTVTFQKGATTLGTGTLAPGGGTGCAQATFSTDTLSVGSHTITADYPGDTTHGPSSDTVIQVVNPAADLSITKADSPDPVLNGGTLTYTLSVHNAGPDPATGVSVTDDLPATVDFVSASPSQGTCSQSPGTVTCDLGTLASGGDATVTITVTPTAAGTISNTATVFGNETDRNPADNTDSEDTTVNPAADLSITKADSPDPVNNGQTLTYTLSVANAGPDAASNVIVTDSLPDSVTFGSASPSQGSCTQSAGMVSCALGSMASGGTATVTITVTPTASGTITNTATVFGDETDPDPADNTDTETTTVDPVADLSIAKSCSPDRVVPGKTVTCTLTITNAGPDGAQQVVVTDDLPEVVTVVGTPTGSGFACTTQSPDPEITCTRATLAAGATATVTYTVRVSEDLGPEVSFTNTARVTSSTFDPDPADNTATETTSTPTCTIDRRTAGFAQVIMGTAGNDVICGSAFGDVIRAGSGNDVVFALGGDDVVFGEAGNDSVFGGAGNDTIDGGDGNDSAYGGAGNDTLSGGNGNDTLSGGAGSDTGVGGSGTDSCATEVRSGCES